MAEESVPAFPTELIRGLKAHAKARGKFADCMFKPDFFTCSQADDLLDERILGRMAHNEDAPRPSPSKGPPVVARPALTGNRQAFGATARS
jgi:hypothetical protein